MTKTATCRSCGAQIVFVKTGKYNKDGKEKSMPVNAETTEPGDTQLDLSHHVSHFSTCPQACAWRS